MFKKCMLPQACSAVMHLLMNESICNPQKKVVTLDALLYSTASRESTTAVFVLWWDSKNTKASKQILVLMSLYVISFQTNETPYNNYRHVTM